jgi:glycosyltransferase involved in cell wall biosynthesis
VRKKLLFINRSYWPDIEATGQLLTELCERLATDYDVTVICGHPVQSHVTVSANDGAARQRQGVTIRRVWHTRFNKASFVGRVMNMVTFLLSATWCAFTTRRPEIVIVETDPPILCLLGRAVQVVRGVKLVCYLQDIYPDVAVALGKLRDGWLTRLLDRWFYGIYRRAEQVVVLSQDMQQHLIHKQVSPERIRCIPNWIDTQAVYPVKQQNAFRQQHGWDHKFVVMYSGNLGMSQPWDQLLGAMDLLQDTPSVQFVLIGGGAAENYLREEIQRRRLTGVTLLNYQPKSELATSLSAADVHLVFLDHRITHCLMPSKIYGVLASGTMSIVVADATSELAQMVAQAQAGIVVSEESSQSLATAIRQIASLPETVRAAGSNARKLAEREFDLTASYRKFNELFQHL